MGKDNYLDGIYEHEGAQNSYYDSWADSYDTELKENAYATPGRIAAALHAHLEAHDAPVLDFACGTGLSGVALKAAGFSVLDGYDVSDGMLEQAGAKGVYRTLLKGDEAQDPQIESSYRAIVAAGAIGPGAAPASVIPPIVDALPSGGLFVLSLNDHGMEDPAFAGLLGRMIDGGRLDCLFAEYGAHLPKIGLGATIYVLRKT